MWDHLSDGLDRTRSGGFSIFGRWCAPYILCLTRYLASCIIIPY